MVKMKMVGNKKRTLQGPSELLKSAPDTIRTYDLLLRRQALYPLSYGRAL